MPSALPDCLLGYIGENENGNAGGDGDGCLAAQGTVYWPSRRHARHPKPRDVLLGQVEKRQEIASEASRKLPRPLLLFSLALYPLDRWSQCLGQMIWWLYFLFLQQSVLYV